MSFIDHLVQADRRHRLASGVVMPFLMPAVVIIGIETIGDPAAINFLVCVVVALAALGLYHLLSRLVLQKLTLKQQTMIGAIGWLSSIPALFLVAKFYLFK